MRHRDIRRDPTIPLLIVLAVVIGLLIAARGVYTGAPEERAAETAGSGSGDPGDADPSGTPEPATEKTPLPPVVLPPPDIPIDIPTPFERVSKMSCLAVSTDTDITAVSYNIKSGHGGGTLAQIAGTLRTSGADVVLLQEVDRFAYRSGRVNMPEYFASQLGGFYSAFGPNVPRPGASDYGTAIVSRYPIVSSVNTHLPRPGNTQQRGLLHVVIDVDGKEVSIYNTHLQNQNEPARLLQAAAINRIVASDPRPQILGGDFNAQPTSRPLNILKAHWLDTWGNVGIGDGRTHPASRLRGRIDYLMWANDGITPVVSDVLPARLSDHMAVRATYTVEGDDDQLCFGKLT